MSRPDTLPQGILPARIIADYCERGLIRLARPADADQIQPASLDLRLGDWAYRVRASFLPGKRSTVAERVSELALHRTINAAQCCRKGSATIEIEPGLQSREDRFCARHLGIGRNFLPTFARADRSSQGVLQFFVEN